GSLVAGVGGASSEVSFGSSKWVIGGRERARGGPSRTNPCKFVTVAIPVLIGDHGRWSPSRRTNVQRSLNVTFTRVRHPNPPSPCNESPSTPRTHTASAGC